MAFVYRLTHPGAILFAAVIGAATFATTSAGAATFSYNYAAGANSYSAPAGTVLSIPLYINETSTNPFDLSLINDELGLTGAAFSLTKTGLSTVAALAGNPGQPALGGFDGSINVVGTTVSEQTSDFNTGALAQFVVAGNYYRVRLGTVNVKVGAAGSMTTFTVGPLAGDGTVTNLTGHDLDDSDDTTLYESAAANNFVVLAPTVAPEPASALIAATTLVALSSRRRHRA